MFIGKIYQMAFPNDAIIIAKYEELETFSMGGPPILWFSHISGDESLLGSFRHKPYNWFHIPSSLMAQIKIKEISENGGVVTNKCIGQETGDDIRACEDILAEIEEMKYGPDADMVKLNDMERRARDIMKEIKKLNTKEGKGKNG